MQADCACVSLNRYGHGFLCKQATASLQAWLKVSIAEAYKMVEQVKMLATEIELRPWDPRCPLTSICVLRHMLSVICLC